MMKVNCRWVSNFVGLRRDCGWFNFETFLNGIFKTNGNRGFKIQTAGEK